MGEIIEFLATIFGGIYWLLLTVYEKFTGKDLGLIGAIVLLLVSAILCAGAVALILHILF